MKTAFFVMDGDAQLVDVFADEQEARDYIEREQIHLGRVLQALPPRHVRVEINGQMYRIVGHYKRMRQYLISPVDGDLSPVRVCHAPDDPSFRGTATTSGETIRYYVEGDNE